MIAEMDFVLCIDDDDKGCMPETVLMQRLKGHGYFVLAHWERALTGEEIGFLEEAFPGLEVKCSTKST